MGHYDSCREAYDDELRRDRLRVGRKDITTRLQKIANALRTLDLQGAGVIEEAIEHLKGK
jgi:hypothetical protein